MALCITSPIVLICGTGAYVWYHLIPTIQQQVSEQQSTNESLSSDEDKEVKPPLKPNPLSELMPNDQAGSNDDKTEDEPLTPEPLIQEEEDYVLTPSNPLLDRAVLYQAQMTRQTSKLPSDKIAVNCKLTKDSYTEPCAFTKVKPHGSKNWISHQELLSSTFDFFLNPDFFSTPKTLYKARISSFFLEIWNKDRTQKLEVYQEDPNISSWTKQQPLISLLPSFAIADTKKYLGETKYFLANLKALYPHTWDSYRYETFNPENKKYKCTLPGTNQTPKDCTILEFDNDDASKGSIYKNTLKLPIGKPSSIDEGKYYLIKYFDDQPLDTYRFKSTDFIKVDIYLDKERKKIPANGPIYLELNFISNAIMHHEEWDAGVGIILV